MKSLSKTNLFTGAAVFLLSISFTDLTFANSASENDHSADSLESLYPRYVASITGKKYKEAAEIIERMLVVEDRGIDNILKTPDDEYPEYVLNLIFDYGICLMQQERWQEGRDCYSYLVKAFARRKAKNI